MTDKQFQNTLGWMVFAMVTVTLSVWTVQYMTVPKASPLPSQVVV